MIQIFAVSALQRLRSQQQSWMAKFTVEEKIAGQRLTGTARHRRDFGGNHRRRIAPVTSPALRVCASYGLQGHGSPRKLEPQAVAAWHHQSRERAFGPHRHRCRLGLPARAGCESGSRGRRKEPSSCGEIETVTPWKNIEIGFQKPGDCVIP